MKIRCSLLPCQASNLLEERLEILGLLWSQHV